MKSSLATQRIYYLVLDICILNFLSLLLYGYVCVCSVYSEILRFLNFKFQLFHRCVQYDYVTNKTRFCHFENQASFKDIDMYIAYNVYTYLQCRKITIYFQVCRPCLAYMQIFTIYLLKISCFKKKNHGCLLIFCQK